MSWVVWLLLAVVVGVAWLGVAGFVRLREPLDRLHCVTFVNAGGGVALLAASAAADGLSSRTGTVVLVLAINLLGGAGRVVCDRAGFANSRLNYGSGLMLISFLLVLLAVTGAGVALTRQPVRQVIALGANGLVLALLFLALQAPDPAFAQIVVGTAAVPALFLVVLASMRMDRRPEDAREGDEK